jgi:uncharacterized protein (TIGR02453 family)
MATTFTGFSPQATKFFAGLEKDNSKTWFESNRKTFDTELKAPFAALLASLPDKHQPFKVFRLNRDTRFSANKSPYKLMHGAVHTRSGGSVEYLHLDKQGLLLAAGHYVMEPDQLIRFRSALLEKSTQQSFKSMASSLKAKGIDLEPGGAAPLKSAPRGVDANHPMIEWLRWKGCVAMTRFSAADLNNGADLQKRIAAWWKTAEPLNAWLDNAIG